MRSTLILTTLLTLFTSSTLATPVAEAAPVPSLCLFNRCHRAASADAIPEPEKREITAKMVKAAVEEKA
jgi:hypothetical protein